MQDLAEIRKRLSDNPQDATALKAAAQYYLEEGSYKQAQSCYSQAVTGNPRLLAGILLDYEKLIGQASERIGPRLSLTGFLLELNDQDAATLELEELLEFDIVNVEAYNLLGRIYHYQNRLDDAITLLERSLAAGVQDVNLTETLAAAYLEKGRLPEAVKFYQEILAQKPEDKSVLRIIGELYARLEKYPEAASYYMTMFNNDPEVAHEVMQRLEEMIKKIEGNIEIRFMLADVYAKAINPEAAVEKLLEIVQLEPSQVAMAADKLRAILKSYPNLPSAILALAGVLRLQGSFSESAEYYYNLLKIKPEYIDEIVKGLKQLIIDCPEQVLAHLYLGEALVGLNRPEEALAEFSEMIDSDPSAAETVIKKCRELLRNRPQLIDAHIVLGRAYLAKGDLQRAAVEAEGVVALNKSSVGAFLLLGEAYNKMNMLRKASQAMSTALSLDPYNFNVHKKFRELRCQEIDQEIAALKTRLQEDQWKLSSHLDLAKLHIMKGEAEAAIRELQQAAKDSLRAPIAYNLLGNLYRSLGRYEMASAQYSRALEFPAPELAKTIHFNQGSIQEALGQIKKAIKSYEAILQDDIDFGNLKKRVKWLKGTSLQSLRNRPLLLVIRQYQGKELIALWGREARGQIKSARKDEVSISFGQEHNQQGFDYYMREMLPAAEEEFSLAVQLDRSFVPAINNLGVALARQGKHEEARLRFNESVQLDPASAIYYNNLGVACLLLGRFDQAQTFLEKSHALDNEAAGICLNLADLYYRRKESKKALELYARVGAFDPLSDLAEQRLLFKVPGKD